MNNTLRTVLIAALTAVVAVAVGFALVGNQSGEPLGASGGITRYPNGGLVARYFKVSTATSQTAGTDGTLTIGTSGTAISKYICATATFNPPTISSSTAATTTIAISGVTVSDPAIATFTSVSSTGQWLPRASVSDAGTTTFAIIAIPGTAAWSTGVDLPTSTAESCVLQ